MKKMNICAGILLSSLFAMTSFAGMVELGVVVQQACKSKLTGEIRMTQVGTYKNSPTAEQACRRFGEDFVPAGSLPGANLLN